MQTSSRTCRTTAKYGLCAKGGASEYVAGTLADRGYDVHHLEDGMNGWARIYETVEVTDYDGAGTLLQYQRPSSGCLGYLVYDDGEAAIIDPCAPLPTDTTTTLTSWAST